MYKTLNLLFFFETPLECGLEKINKVKVLEPKLKLFRNSLQLEVNQELIKGKVKNFDYNESFDYFETLDFFPKEMLVTALREGYINELKVDYSAEIKNKTGYVIESFVSFPDFSEFAKSYETELNRKLKIYFN